MMNCEEKENQRSYWYTTKDSASEPVMKGVFTAYAGIIRRLHLASMSYTELIAILSFL
jgi:hypothetical protein